MDKLMTRIYKGQNRVFEVSKLASPLSTALVGNLMTVLGLVYDPSARPLASIKIPMAPNRRHSNV